MAKARKGNHGSVPNRQLYSRLSYLHQAATFLGSQVGKSTKEPKSEQCAQSQLEQKPTSSDTLHHHSDDQLRLQLARKLLTDLRATSLKCQIRLSPAVKHTICKFCDTLLIEGETSTSVVENKSKGGKKPWADVLVVSCNTCGGARRFPVQAPRQKRRPQREQVAKDVSKSTIKENKSEGSTDVVMQND